MNSSTFYSRKEASSGHTCSEYAELKTCGHTGLLAPIHMGPFSTRYSYATCKDPVEFLLPGGIINPNEVYNPIIPNTGLTPTNPVTPTNPEIPVKGGTPVGPVGPIPGL